MARSGAAGGGLGLIVQAWQAAFGGASGNGLAIDTSLVPSSTFSDLPGQETASQSDPLNWPSLLIDPKASKKAAAGAGSGSGAKVSTALASAVGQAVASAGLASSSAGSGGALAPAASATAAPQWCEFSAAGRGDPGIILNEVAWMGSSQDANDEWLELKNISGRSAAVGGWQVLNRSGSIKINLAATSTIAQEGFLILKRTKDYSGALANTGDWLKVLDRDCKVVDDLNASSGWPGGNNTTKKTLERDVSTTGWHTSVNAGGSPGAQNSVIAIVVPSANASSTSSQATQANQNSSTTTVATTTPSAATSTDTNTDTNASSSLPEDNVPIATSTPTSTPPEPPTIVTTTPALAPTHLVIAAVQITGGEGLTDQDYIKIFNPTSESANVSGWKLRKRTKTGTESSIKVFPDGSTIAPGGYFTWANSVNGFSATIGANASSTQTLSSDNSIALLDASDVVVDAVAWGSGHVTPYIEGSAYPENPGANQQLARKAEGGTVKDTENNATDFELLP